MQKNIFFEKIAPGCTLTLGIDSLDTFLSMFIHPLALIRKKYHNSLLTMRFDNLKVLRLDSKIVIQHLQ